MIRKVNLLILLFVIILGCTQNSNKKDIWKKEIMEAELVFSNMSQKEGIAKAFSEFAADDVVINRNDSLIIGKEGLQQFYGQTSSPNRKVELSWKPDFVDVSSSGDLGYTYGKYLFSVTDSTGQIQSSTGIFHTVWKRQADGKWRFVWD